MSDKAEGCDPARTLEAVILELCARAEPGRTVSPADAAKAFSRARGEGELEWRKHLGNVRSTSVKLAAAGRLVVYRKGKPADASDFRGVYRLGLPL